MTSTPKLLRFFIHERLLFACMRLSWILFFVSADFKELKELYELEESHVEHRNEGPTSDYYDPLKHGNRESNRQ